MPVLNNPGITGATLANIQQTADLEYEVILIDNGSMGDGNRRVAECFPAVRYFRNEAREPSIAKAWNQGLRAAQGDILFVMASNTYASQDDWMSRLVLAVDGKRVLAGPLVRDHNQLSEFEGKCIPYVEGWCCAFSRATLAELGGYDEDMAPWGFEDAEFSARALFLGYEIQRAPVRMIHPRGATVTKHFSVEQVQQINQTNRRRFVEKMTMLKERLAVA